MYNHSACGRRRARACSCLFDSGDATAIVFLENRIVCVSYMGMGGCEGEEGGTCRLHLWVMGFEAPYNMLAYSFAIELSVCEHIWPENC